MRGIQLTQHVVEQHFHIVSVCEIRQVGPVFFPDGRPVTAMEVFIIVVFIHGGPHFIEHLVEFCLHVPGKAVADVDCLDRALAQVQGMDGAVEQRVGFALHLHDGPVTAPAERGFLDGLGFPFFKWLDYGLVQGTVRPFMIGTEDHDVGVVIHLDNGAILGAPGRRDEFKPFQHPFHVNLDHHRFLFRFLFLLVFLFFIAVVFLLFFLEQLVKFIRPVYIVKFLQGNPVDVGTVIAAGIARGNPVRGEVQVFAVCGERGTAFAHTGSGEVHRFAGFQVVEKNVRFKVPVSGKDDPLIIGGELGIAVVEAPEVFFHHGLGFLCLQVHQFDIMAPGEVNGLGPVFVHGERATVGFAFCDLCCRPLAVRGNREPVVPAAHGLVEQQGLAVFQPFHFVHPAGDAAFQFADELTFSVGHEQFTAGHKGQLLAVRCHVKCRNFPLHIILGFNGQAGV